MTAQQDNPYLTITLTDRPPVRLKIEEWPIIAESQDKDFDNQYEWTLIVRQHHEDGRALIYGIYSYDANWQNARNFNARGGELLEKSGDLAGAIRRVGQWMMSQEHSGGDENRWASLINECIADLPPQEL